MRKKKIIPQGIRLRVLEESGYQCAFCGHRDGLNLTVHHILRERDHSTYLRLVCCAERTHIVCPFHT